MKNACYIIVLLACVSVFAGCGSQAGEHGGGEELSGERLPEPYGAYVDVLEQILTQHTDPNGREYSSDPNHDFDNNTFAIADVDLDGQPELIFRYMSSNGAGMCEVVYGYDPEAVLTGGKEYEVREKDIMPDLDEVRIVYHPATRETLNRIMETNRQAAIYAEQAEEWMWWDEAQPYASQYLMYDLDRDGSLELIANFVQGSGIYSENHFYGLTQEEKVRELPLVELCEGTQRDWIAAFDLAWYDFDTAYQDETGVIYYEGMDYTRDGSDGRYDETGFYYLKGTTVYQDSIRRSSSFYERSEDGGLDSEELEVHYYGILDREEITEEEYTAVREEYVQDMTGLQVYQKWVGFGNEELEQGWPTEEQIRLKLLDSFWGSE